LQQFRQEVHACFVYRADALMNLVDTLCGNTDATSIAELSLSPLFRYQYSSVYDSIDNLYRTTPSDGPLARQQWEQKLAGLIIPRLPFPSARQYRLIGIDATSVRRQYAQTLADRSMVYAPNSIAGNKPITIGHRYVTISDLPEKGSQTSPPWAVPLSVRRVSSDTKETTVGVEQIQMLFEAENMGFQDQLCVQVVDSTFSAVAFLDSVAKYDNLITVARLRSNRTLYHSPETAPPSSKRGHPRWYGPPFKLNDSTTWTQPDILVLTHTTTHRGRCLQVELAGWYNLKMRGTKEHPMQNAPFTLIRAIVTDKEGNGVFPRPLWLCVMGARRTELNLLEAWWAYRQRYDMEHFFRFGKQRLLMERYQTPETEHEQNWWYMVQLAYVQLYLVHPLAQSLPRPWERYLPRYQTHDVSISDVQRDFSRIIATMEPQPKSPKPRGKSPGRQKGVYPTPRQRHGVIKKRAPAQNT
jgi:hypothetical protein